jgi:predicted secreted Zn-dependent protease
VEEERMHLESLRAHSRKLENELADTSPRSCEPNVNVNCVVA